MLIKTNPSQTGYTRGGQQKAGGPFLMLFDMPGSRAIRAAVRSVQLHQLGHFMMGQTNVGGHEITVSGQYGHDGLPRGADGYDGLWAQLVPVPDSIAEAFWRSEGGADRDLRSWAREHMEELQKAGRKKPVPSKKRRKGHPSRQTTRERRLTRSAAKHGISLKPKAIREATLFHPSTMARDPLEERASEYKMRRCAIAHGSSFYGGPGSKYPSVFDPRSAADCGLRPTHEEFMELPRPALPNPPRRSKKARRRSR